MANQDNNAAEEKIEFDGILWNAELYRNKIQRMERAILSFVGANSSLGKAGIESTKIAVKKHFRTSPDALFNQAVLNLCTGEEPAMGLDNQQQELVLLTPTRAP